MRPRFYNLKHPKLRQSWNKINLYNLQNQVRFKTRDDATFFQQKWKAKSVSRAYHGEQIREKQWQRMYRSNMPSVTPMSSFNLSASDGVAESAGTGSGLEKRLNPRATKKIPHSSMVYWPMERRLDTAIFRALFASSARQARQFVVHGSVKVNGEKMIYPGYLLNPGDMFQVDPERVLYATGARKAASTRRRGRRIVKLRRMEKATTATSEGTYESSTQQDIASGDADSAAKKLLPEVVGNNSVELNPNPTLRRKGMIMSALDALVTRAQSLVRKLDTITLQQQRELVAFLRTIPRDAKPSKPVRLASTHSEDCDAELSEILVKISNAAIVTAGDTDPENFPAWAKHKPENESALRALIREARQHPIDASKPYATPWRPRDYMSPFAFIPRYLEVNQNVCSAVYLRHPVARPGAAEVPSPYPPTVHQLVHTWYLRRR